MEKKKTQKKEAGFNPASLTKEQRNSVIEYEFGVHPKFMLFQFDQIHIDLWNLEAAGKHFNGFFPQQLRTQLADEKDIEKQRGKLGY